MRKLLILLILVSTSAFAQTHIEYISEKCDSMAFINIDDINTINKVFNERNQLDSINKINEQIIKLMNLENSTLNSAILKQSAIIENDKAIIKKLENDSNIIKKQYETNLKKEQRKTISFQTTTGLGIIAIILLILL